MKKHIIVSGVRVPEEYSPKNWSKKIKKSIENSKMFNKIFIIDEVNTITDEQIEYLKKNK